MIDDAAAGYAACLFDFYGSVESRPAREHDGSWYLGVVIGTSGRYLPFMWLVSTFGGRLLAPDRWLIIGADAAAFLTAARPHVQYAHEMIDHALAGYTSNLSARAGGRDAVLPGRSGGMSGSAGRPAGGGAHGSPYAGR